MTYYGKLAEKWNEPIVHDVGLKSSLLAEFPLPTTCPATLILLSENMVKGMMLAGGSCMTIVDPLHQFTDIDIWCNNLEAKRHTESLLKMWGLTRKSNPQLEIQDWEDELVKVQVIYATSLKSLEDLVSTFDIEACKIGFDHEKVIYGQHTFKDITGKKINVPPVNPEPVKLLHRIIKYVSKGYAVDPQLIQDIWDKNKNLTGTGITTKASDDMRDMLTKAILDQMNAMKGMYPPLLPAAPPELQPYNQPYNPPPWLPVEYPAIPAEQWITTTTDKTTITYVCAQCGGHFDPSFGQSHVCTIR